MSRFRGVREFITEIHRRSLWQVLGIYVAGSWVALEVVGTLTESFGLPAAFPALALSLLVLGLPLVLATAFVQEGGRRSSESAEESSFGFHHRAFTWRNTAVGAAMILLVLGGVAGWLAWGGVAPDSDSGPEDSIAVLPFADMSPGSDQEHFSDGITEEILNALTRLEGLRVAARTSSFAYKGRDTDIREIGRELNVEHVLEGSVRKHGDTVRVTAQLISVSDGFHVWSDVYERELRGIFAIQDEITRAIVRALEVELRGERVDSPLVAVATRDPEAYNEYLLGRYHWNRRNQNQIRTAIDHFEMALELDPGLASAHAGLAGAYATLGYYNYMAPEEAFERARQSALRALELDPSNGEAYAVVGYIRTEYDWDWEGAEDAFRRALKLNPGHPDTHRWYALTLAARGRLDESVECARTAAELDPISPIVHRGLGRHHYFRREYEAARQSQRRALQIAPGFFPALYLMAQIELAEGRNDDALEWIREAEEVAPRHPVTRGLAIYALARSEQGAEAERRYRELRADLGAQPGVAFWLAVAAVGLDRPDEAVDWLERARKERSSFMAALAVDPLLDPLQDHPKFRQLRRRLGV